MPHLPAPKLPQAREARRLRSLRGYGILDTPREAAFDDIVRLASLFCGTPISVVNFIDEERQWFKAEVGLGVRETPLETSICAHAILEHDVLVIPDTRKDARLCDNPLVTTEPGLRFYAGALLKSPDGMPLGTVCVLDTRPRHLDDDQIEALRRLARQVMGQLELRRLLADARDNEERLTALIAAAGHDLKAPLRSAAYSIERASRTADGEAVERLSTARDAILSADRQLTQLVAVASRGAHASPGATTELQRSFDALEGAWRADAARRGVALRFAPTALAVQGPDALVETMLGNLVSNALKYTSRSGAVDIHAEASEEMVRVIVRDSGIGITGDQQEAIFAAFQQVDRGTEGLGLGLWIVCEVAASLGGRVHVESVEGEGSTFIIELPAA